MNFRPATLEDADVLYGWRIENETLPWYNNPPVNRTEHNAWVEARVAPDSTVRIWILEEDGARIGAARLDSNNEAVIEIDAAWRGKGYGTVALRWLLGQAGGRVKANIDADNVAGRAMLLKAGFEERDDVEFWLWRG